MTEYEKEVIQRIGQIHPALRPSVGDTINPMATQPITIPIDHAKVPKILERLRELGHVEVHKTDVKGTVSHQETGEILFTFEYVPSQHEVVITPINLPADIGHDDLKARLVAEVEALSA